jgi:hypothetical protein
LTILAKFYLEKQAEFSQSPPSSQMLFEKVKQLCEEALFLTMCSKGPEDFWTEELSDFFQMNSLKKMAVSRTVEGLLDPSTNMTKVFSELRPRKKKSQNVFS